MGRKGEQTRGQVIAAAARLMNDHGWLDVSLSQVMEASGLQKGGLYRHFESRDALAYAAFDHAVAQVRDRLLGSLTGRAGACERLLALVNAFHPDEGDVPLPGGCPIMNGAIESDHAHAGLRQRALEAMSQWRGLIERIVRDGMRARELRAGLAPADVSATLIAALEGAVMLSHLYGSAQPLHAVSRHLHHYIEHELRNPVPRKGRP